MFERVITQTIQRISSEVLRDRQSVPLTEILDDERIPTRFKPFFATEVRWWLYNDIVARSSNKRFDFSHPELAALLDYLEQVMFRHARFEHDEFISTLDGAVKLTYNYLCRPQTTLKWYIFRGQPVKPLSEVMLRFESFLDYEYIGNVFAEWVERKVRERATFEAISATEFERIIRRIDDQILLSCTVDELLTLLDPIFEFIGEGDDHQVPLDALIIFFDDKNIARLVEHLERFRTGNATITRERFVAILEELLTDAEENPEADFSSVYQNDELDDVVRRHLEAEGRYTPMHGAGIDAGEDYEQQLAGAIQDRPAVASDDVGTASTIDDVVATLEDDDASIGEVASDVDATSVAGDVNPPEAYTALNLPPASGESLRSRQTGADYAARPGAAFEREPQMREASTTEQPGLLDPLLERKVLKKVFNRDQSAFDETMRRLAEATSWRQASQILDELFIRFDVDPYSRTALRFTDSVYSRYVPKSHN